MDAIELGKYGAAEREEILDGEPDPFGTASLGLVWRDKTSHLGIVVGGRLIAHAGWVPIGLRMGGDAVPALGLGEVIVHRSWRRRGVGKAVIRAAEVGMRQTSTQFGLLFCRPALVQFYEALGWRALLDEVTADQPDGAVTMPLRTCWLPLHESAALPPGRIAVDGLPF